MDNMEDAVKAMNCVQAAYVFMPEEKKTAFDDFFNHICEEIGRNIYVLERPHLDVFVVIERLKKLQNYIYSHFEE